MADTSSVTTLLEQIARRFENALNSRDFSTTSSAWDFMAPQFRGEAEYVEPPKTLSLAELMDVLKQLVTIFPDWHLRVVSMTTSVRELTGTAEVFMHVETTGAPPGITKEGVGILEFQRTDKGSWLVVRHRSAAGLDMVATGA
ncbi:hypothetical protein CLAFUW4_08130 [Fulvia fulva]|uniref:uncharacterized protein n=1 Tax=Passalora fulva TaxID=5499 RepID=UPI002852CA33|nr:uncharacterized protein CLAFUR5_20252 [Fulvia fulva]KAK4629538.1 hypothetical protein CLAFUR4_08135 [Fulvia fulva]KAK4630205.1 hypothetical protein CLAFUR0_08130 [Fulvia fulva]WMI38827.1 hypothetical protein CLAFUR5_20252 [Fulvia fulva]WPV12752.1 hypothetical protein CLAFUW4_08130 [Fulvia fulva]WPV27341.1 hypothetical protein CLAFUW7_08130 [Fulvia fulva]